MKMLFNAPTSYIPVIFSGTPNRYTTILTLLVFNFYKKLRIIFFVHFQGNSKYCCWKATNYF